MHLLLELLSILQRLGRWARRRDLQLLILAMPVISLALSQCRDYTHADGLRPWRAAPEHLVIVSRLHRCAGMITQSDDVL